MGIQGYTGKITTGIQDTIGGITGGIQNLVGNVMNAPLKLIDSLMYSNTTENVFQEISTLANRFPDLYGEIKNRTDTRLENELGTHYKDIISQNPLSYENKIAGIVGEVIGNMTGEDSGNGIWDLIATGGSAGVMNAYMKDLGKKPAPDAGKQESQSPYINPQLLNQPNQYQA